MTGTAATIPTAVFVTVFAFLGTWVVRKATGSGNSESKTERV